MWCGEAGTKLSGGKAGTELCGEGGTELCGVGADTKLCGEAGIELYGVGRVALSCVARLALSRDLGSDAGAPSP